MECPKCGGPTYDNRESKKNPKAPDYRCKDENCKDDKGYTTAVWLKDEQGDGPPPMREQPPLEDARPQNTDSEPKEPFDIQRFKNAIIDAQMLGEWSKGHGVNVPDVEIVKWATTLFINRG